MNLQQLNEEFKSLSVTDRLSRLYEHFSEDEVLVTSSFGANSAYLLYQISKVRPSQPIHFIDTQYHFAETLEYKSELSTRFGLHVIDIAPEATETINKVAPLNRIKDRFRVWLSGLMAFQTPFRSGLQVFEEAKQIIKFHPMIDLDEGQFRYEYGLYKLPNHPLEKQGYSSIGCTHCTVKGEKRNGRWAGSEQYECGIHLNGFEKRKTAIHVRA
jgi:phosphoadenosine phosphosulfate reductase